jgi:hypothetical protein
MSNLIIPPDVCVSIMDAAGNQEVLYRPTEKGLEYHQCTAANALLVGGRGSGKSTIGRWDCHMRALAHPGYTYIVLRRTYPELAKSHLMYIPAEMKKLGGYFHHTDKIAYYPNGSRGYFNHCQSEADVLNLLSAQFCLAFFDELSTFDWDMFTKLAASVRVPVDSGLTAMVRAATNPFGVSAEQINKYFVTKDVDPEEDPDYNPNDWYSIKANLIDNPHLDREQYVKRFAGIPSYLRKAWVDGEFAFENALFDFRPTVRDEEGHPQPYHVIKKINLDQLVEKATIYRAFDWGYNPDPSICLWIAHLGNRYIVFHEKLWFKTIVSDIAEDIKAEDARLGIKHVNMTYADPTIDVHSGVDVRTMKDVFEMHGVPIECSINKRELFASHIHTALAEEAAPGIPRLQCYDGGKYAGCPYLIKTLPQMRFDPKHPMRLADHAHDHATIALAYFLISSGAMERRGAHAVEKPKRWMIPKTIKQFVLGSENVRTKL